MNTTTTQYIEDNIFNFDYETLNKLKRLSLANMKNEIKTILKKITIETKDVPAEFNITHFPNIYLPCHKFDDESKLEKVEYCYNKKFIIDDVESYIDIMASDLRNPIKEQYILSGLLSDNTIDYFDFKMRPIEIISIRKI